MDPAFARCDANQVARYFYIFNERFCVSKSEAGVWQLIQQNIITPVQSSFDEF